MIIEGYDAIEDDIINIFTACVYHEYVPSAWQLANSAIIAKPGKSDYSKIKAYRIISLSSNLLKLLETLILWHLQEDLKIDASLNPNQYGFRTGHSTDAIITKVVNKIQDSLKQGGHAMGVFLDIQGAFDNLPHNAIKDALDKTAARGKISNWITSMVSSRYVTLQLCGEQITRKIPKGCPQGGVLSPFLWNLVVNDLLQQFKGYKNMLAYADDLLLLQLGLDINTIKQTTGRHIKNCIEWCTSKGLQISEVKTQVMFWTRTNRKDKPKTFTINNIQIPVTDSTRYLGVIIDENLNWNKHIKSTTKKCKNLFFACKKAIAKKWGLKPKNVLWLYNMVILPKLTYGCVAWAMRLNANNISALEAVQNLAIKSALRACSSTPKLATTTMLNMLPIDLQIQQTCFSRAISLMAEGHWEPTQVTLRKSTYKTNMEIIDGEVRHIIKELYPLISDKIRPVFNINQKFQTHIDCRAHFKVSTNRYKQHHGLH